MNSQLYYFLGEVMGYQGELKYVLDELLNTVGVRLAAEDRVILRERAFYRPGGHVPIQEDIAEQLGCSQVHVSNLENSLIGRIKRATKRASQANAASERRAEMLASLYEAIVREAELAGLTMDDIVARDRGAA
jgi:hypothetical protein